MSDRELLEMAAKAAGIVGEWSEAYGVLRVDDVSTLGFHHWNPLIDDGDALRLAVKLRLHVDHHRSGVDVWVMSWALKNCEVSRFTEDTGDDLADTRRAIVRAAAAIGEQHGS